MEHYQGMQERKALHKGQHRPASILLSLKRLDRKRQNSKPVVARRFRIIQVAMIIHVAEAITFVDDEFACRIMQCSDRIPYHHVQQPPQQCIRPVRHYLSRLDGKFFTSDRLSGTQVVAQVTDGIS
uniref:Uncharacterized protein n=1 Tax=Physcomitrium patens TaxID=3218 RepID=A0A2K1KCL7_PHYPA|nr:hypothetical protein PHYPA_010713 [Physcomitrium patens]